MRVLMATTAGAGHLGPLVPFGAACRRAGHEVVVAAPAEFAQVVERAGFSTLLSRAWPWERMSARARLPELSSDEANLV